MELNVLSETSEKKLILDETTSRSITDQFSHLYQSLWSLLTSLLTRLRCLPECRRSPYPLRPRCPQGLQGDLDRDQDQRHGSEIRIRDQDQRPGPEARIRSQSQRPGLEARARDQGQRPGSEIRIRDQDQKPVPTG